MKKQIYILLIIVLSSCSIIKRPSHYPDRMVIDTKIKSGKYYHYLDGMHDLKTKARRFSDGDTVRLKKFGRKYLIIKKWK